MLRGTSNDYFKKLVDLPETFDNLTSMKITSISQRREAVNAINEYDANNGVGTSQKAKHEKPLWWFILAILNGRDGKPMSAFEITDKLAQHGLNYTVPAITAALKVMMNLDKSIHPCRRNCGISCYDAVRKMGEIDLDFVPSQGRTGMKARYFLNSYRRQLSSNRRSLGIRL
jgi:hypothetical protein